MAEESSACESSSSSESSNSANYPLIVPARNSQLPVAMTDYFAHWQSRFHLPQQNVVPDSENPHEQVQDHEQEEWNRLMSDDISQKNHHLFDSHHTFSSQAIGSTEQGSYSQGAYSQEHVQPVGGEPTAKRRALKIPPKKSKKSKLTVNLSDDEEEEDANVMQRWTDSEVSHLISFRSEMDQTFKQNAKKQGVNTWEKLQVRMVAACDHFSKSIDACRKKWKAVYNQYCNDKRLLQISGEGRKVSCKFFEEIDQGFNNASNVRKVVHGDADGTPNPYPPDENQVGDTQDSAPVVRGLETGSVCKEISPSGSSKGTKKTQGTPFDGFLAEMVECNREMVDCNRNMVLQTTRIADDIHGNSFVLKELQFNMARLIDKL